MPWHGGSRRHMPRNRRSSEREFTATKAAVLSTISHEFRTPLTVILGGTQTLERLGDRITPDARADLFIRWVCRRLGLGLHLVRRLCDAVGANLRLLPRPGGGTDAVIHIPIGGRAADVRGGDIDLSVESIVAGRSPDPIVSVKSAPPS